MAKGFRLQRPTTIGKVLAFEKPDRPVEKQYHYDVTFIDDGELVTKMVTARHEFEATRLAGAFGKEVVSVVNLDM